MQNVDEDDGEQVGRVPFSKGTKTMNRMINNRYLNQNIYTTFLQKRYDECLLLIDRCKPDQFKIFIKSLIEKNKYRLDRSLELLNECHIMDKLNYGYLKCISKNYYLLGKYKSSLEVAKDAYKMNSNDYEIFYIMGKISIALGDKTTAMEYFKRSITKDPNEQAYLEQARIHMDDLQFIPAADILKECINFAEQNADAFQLLGTCYVKMGKSDQAIAYYAQALQRQAGRAVSLIGLGSLSQARGQIEQALEMFKKAYRNSANSAVLWNNIGIAMQNKKKQIAAFCCFKRALFLDPFRWDVHANLALLFISRKKFLPASIHLRSAIKLSKDAVLFNLLGACLSQLKDYGNAERAFYEGLKMEPANQEIQCNLLLCWVKQGATQKAKKQYTELNRRANNSAVRDKLLEVRDMLNIRG